ncbi:MAG: ABC transporter ATP-binding protein [Clostridia bacterium]|nr:ABC transporter ATP-binding protein [Clostridia bacterium]
MDIKLNNVCVNFDNKVVLDDFSASFEESKITCILGASGVGKTTILNAICGTLSFSGVVEKDEGAVSYIFQNERLIPSISVYKNLDLILKSKIKSKVERKKLVKKMLNAVELIDEKNSFPFELSGGMAQRVAIARGFLFPSKIMLMDEAFKGLDAALKARLVSVFISLWEQDRRTVVFVTHSIDEALLLAHRIVVVKGSPAKIILEEEIATPLQDRHLTNLEFDKVRKNLLATMVKD